MSAQYRVDGEEDVGKPFVLLFPLMVLFVVVVGGGGDGTVVKFPRGNTDNSSQCWAP